MSSQRKANGRYNNKSTNFMEKRSASHFISNRQINTQ